ncbi:Xaa-Pro peptidase family protein [Aeromicrobium fastidiosum]|uniref:M24 family metallopeptidase n=1 Tax=Aeromicrobium fastidiosum TaxID=52699 RepID=UPI0020231AA2|nr:Xaa-Pro peptidase family protein [Aeromicrobium fastidiosum]MCL8252564.1 Xaa-Pro peptidase family protein [Aeromicrobium fastidiosum]
MTAAARRAALTEALAAKGLDGLLVTTLVNVRYLTGFTGSNGALVVPVHGDPLFLTDGRYRDQAAAELPDVAHRIGRDLLATAATRMTSGTWGIESHTLSVDAHRQLVAATGDDRLTGADRVVESLREVKDADEIDALRRACAISTDALEQLLAGPLVGRSEREVARDLENRMLDLGAEAIAFETILAAGDHTAVPHHHPTDRVLATGDLLKIDFGARVDGYHADCTRTVVLGRADDWQREVHAAVRASQQAGLDLLRDGADVAASDAAARGSLEASGWLEAFTTGLGHGVGLQIHEDPFIAGSHAGKLTRRTVLTMEPGIYVPGRGGVRIEDTVLVTAGAPEVLTTMTKDLLEIG